jgi:hypothetical protein
MPEGTLSNVLRMLKRPVDEPITSNNDDLTSLQLCAFIAGITRFEDIAVRLSTGVFLRQ